jgi:hypothetical protein
MGRSLLEGAPPAEGERVFVHASRIASRAPRHQPASLEARSALGRTRQSCADGFLLCVRLTERALCLNDCASDARFRLR